MSPADQTFTYRGRSLEELVPRIRRELGDDAVIVARRDTTSGGVGGFFAKREIEVDVRPGESAAAAPGPGGPGAADAPAIPQDASAAARAFAQQLAQAQQRHGGVSSADLGRPVPATSPEVDALPRSSDVSVDDLFPPAPPSQAQGLAALFEAGKAPAEPEPPAAEEREEPEQPADTPAGEPRSAALASGEPHAGDVPEPEGPITFEWPVRRPEAETPEQPESWRQEPEGLVPEQAEPEGLVPEELRREPSVDEAPPPAASEPAATWADPEPEPADPAEADVVDQPTGIFDYVGSEPDAAAPAQAGAPGRSADVRAAVRRLADRGLREELAEAIAGEAMAALRPLRPAAEPRELLVEALARRIPLQPLRRGARVVGFVGPAGAGKTRCVARLAAAHARHGALPVAVLAVRAPDEGAELARLLAPYDVTLHAVDGGAEGAARIASLRGDHLVVVDTPGVSPRSSTELRALRLELDALAPDELHLAVSATVGPAAARELVRGVRELGVGALAVTHADETEMLGTVVGLAIDCALPMSFLARGQAVDAGLEPASAHDLAVELLP